jgi:hypothetical protein
MMSAEEGASLKTKTKYNKGFSLFRILLCSFFPIIIRDFFWRNQSYYTVFTSCVSVIAKCHGMLPPSFQGPGCACVRPVPIVFVGVAVVAIAAFLLRVRGRSGFGDRPGLPVAILVVAKPIPHVRLELVLA